MYRYLFYAKTKTIDLFGFLDLLALLCLDNNGTPKAARVKVGPTEVSFLLVRV